MAKKKVVKKRVVRDPEEGIEREEEYEEEVEESTVRMKVPAGVGATGIPVGDEVIQIVPDKKGFVDVPKGCTAALRSLGYSIVHEDKDAE